MGQNEIATRNMLGNTLGTIEKINPSPDPSKEKKEKTKPLECMLTHLIGY
jgi:hypothetical protein